MKQRHARMGHGAWVAGMLVGLFAGVAFLADLSENDDRRKHEALLVTRLCSQSE